MTCAAISRDLESIAACDDAVVWVKKLPRRTTRLQAWQKCDRADWMLWLVGKFSGPPEGEGRKKLVLCACEIARKVLPIFEKNRPDDDRPRRAIETVERWARGDATINELREGAASAAAAAYAASYAASYAIASAASAASAAAKGRDLFFKRTAKIVRKHYPKPPNVMKAHVRA